MPDLSKFFKNVVALELDKSKKRILLIYWLVLLFVFVLYFYLFLKPTFARLLDLIPKVRTFRTDINLTHDGMLFEAKLKKRLQALEGKLDDYEKRLSREKELPKFLENLSGMARSSHVKILGITPLEKKQKGEGKKESVYQEVPIGISAQSGYHELGAFINKLENDQRYMQISNIKIKSNRANPRKHDIEFVVCAYTVRKGE